MSNPSGIAYTDRYPMFSFLKYPHPMKIKKASLTIEAAFVLPLFFLAFVTLILFMDAAAQQAAGNLSLSNKARRIAAVSYAAGDMLEGTAGEGTWIDLKIQKAFRFPFSLLPVPALCLAERARVYPWIGYTPGSDDASEEDDSDEMVYVSDWESVYHTHADCTHLDLTVIATTTGKVGSLRNAYGEKYRKCEHFPKGYTGPVYVTAKGNCYYPSLHYGGVTRHVSIKKKADVGGRKLCDRCAERDAAGRRDASGEAAHDAA